MTNVFEVIKKVKNYPLELFKTIPFTPATKDEQKKVALKLKNNLNEYNIDPACKFIVCESYKVFSDHPLDRRNLKEVEV